MSDELGNNISHDELNGEDTKQLLEAHKRRKRPLWARIARFVFRTFMIFLVLLGLLRFIISYPAVQNKLISWTTDYLSERLNTTVQINYIEIDLFDKFSMDNFLIEDLDGDTLLFTEKLTADFALVSFLRSRTYIDELYLKNAQVNVIAPKNGQISNLQFIFDSFFPPGPPQKPTAEEPIRWDFNIKKIRLEAIQATIFNHYTGILMEYDLKDAVFDIQEMLLSEKKILLDRMYLNEVNASYIIDTTYATYVPRPQDTIQYEEYIDTFSRMPWYYEVASLKLNNSSFHFVDKRSTLELKPEDFNTSDMFYQDININLQRAVFTNNELLGKLKEFKLKEQKGFVLEELSGDLVINERLAALTDMKLITPNSYLQDSLAFKYKYAKDWSDFVNKVKMDIKLKKSELAIQDLLMIVPALKDNPFFSSNINETLKISGRIYDKVNRLKANDLKLQIGKETRLEGRFRSLDLTNTSDALLNMRLKYLYTNMKNVQLLFKDVKIPEQMMRLGKLSFKGNFDGFLLDFVAKGQLKTDLGFAESDMNFNFKKGRSYGSYKGFFGLKDFELGTWLDHKDFGKITFKTDIEGKGYSIKDIDAVLDGKVNELTFKDYTYRDIKIDGLSKPNLFDGVLGIDDENVKLQFNGKVDFNDTLPRFDLNTDLKYVNLKPLNLFKEDYRLTGNVQLNFSGLDPNEIDGFASLRDFKLYHQRSLETVSSIGEKNKKIDLYSLDSIRITSGIDYKNARFYTVESDILGGSLVSNFDLINIQNLLLNYVAIHFPKFTNALDLKRLVTGDSTFVYQAQSPNINEYYDLNLAVQDTKNWMQLIDSDIGNIQDLTIKSHFDSKKIIKEDSTSHLFFEVNSPTFRFGDLKIGKSFVRLDAIKDSCEIDANVTQMLVGDSLDIPSISIENTIEKDRFQFKINGDKVGGIAEKLKFRGQIEAVEDLFKITIDTSDFIIYNKEWSISKGNLITIDGNRVVPENVVLSNSAENEAISLSSFGRKGLQFDIKNLALNWLEEFVDLKDNKFKGRVNGIVKIEDLFKAQNFEIIATVDTLVFNNEPLGRTVAVVRFPSINAPIKIKALINKNDRSRVSINGSYMSPSISANTSNDHYFNFKVSARAYPLKIIENFVGDFVSDTEGAFDADIIAAGTPDKPELSGNVRLSKVGLKVDYLQTFYRIDKAIVKVTNNAFIIQGETAEDDGCIATDKEGKTAFLEGAVFHDNLKNFNFNITMNSAEFLLLDTNRDSPELFYGTAIGSVTLKLTGSLESPDMNIFIKSGKGTKLVIPISNESSASEVKFIKFTNEVPDSLKEDNKRTFQTPEGLNVEMNLDITPTAEVRLVFDEQAGDEIRGQGRGNLQIEVTRTGEFKMSGTYTIEKGEYLFTYQNFINKPFEVRRGGTIVWTGDPFDATMNLSAYYRNLKVAPYKLILEYLATDEETVTAQKSTKVDLKMLLRGSLFNPDISFDLEFPSVDNTIKSYIDSKLKIVKEDKNELNRQVFGLIILGDFLPSNESATTGQVVIETGLNTLTELLSNQFSIYVSDLLTEIVGTNGVISSIDVDVNYRISEYEDIDLDNTIRGNELQVGLRNGLFNDRLVISGNVNYDDAVGGQITSNFEVEWVITKDGRWRMRAYNSGEVVVSDYRNKAGVGVSYRREFNNLRELFQNILKKKSEE
ncbi:MAG: translocation/assembly module TamB domain-containing protein [Saprospiraceae bacterium]